ncbi:hypothetical protein [Sphingomicrobium aestuariivivum]|uniref:hypothetical protein n=1 Tax=Sphingomicrobium aestuariivivum TaxID=1582356 RepID=UPI001FD6EC7A|nr:hypothetical protein [Sphingomicrobium aestuariivivum]MCJ8191231.1 hypothetical protein [Sphingomicrobium aestuariivivum]
MLTLMALALQGAPITDTSSLEYDLQCVSALSFVSQQEGVDRAQLVPMSTFFLGRIDARGTSGAALKAAGERAMAKLEGADVNAVLQHCSGRIDAANAKLQALES